MAGLACCIITAIEQLAVYNNSAANAGTESNCNKICNSLAGTCFCFAECRTVSIVFKINRFAELRLKNIFCRNIIES